MTPLSGIQLDISLGGRRVNRCPECVVTASRRAVLTEASLTIPDPGGDVERSLATGQAVSIRYGHRNQEPGEFAGTVMRWHPSPTARDQVVIHAAGPERSLLSTRMTEAWFEEPAPIIARRILAASGFVIGQVDLPDVVIPRMTLAGATLREAMMTLLHSIEDGFAHKLSHFSLRLEHGVLVLDGEPVDGVQPIVATGSGLIRNSTGKGCTKEVETYLTPFMGPGMRFTLRDKRRGIDGVFMAERVRHAIRPKSVRTFLTYGGQYDRFQC